VYQKLFVLFALAVAPTVPNAAAAPRAQRPPIVVKARNEQKLLFVSVSIDGKGPFWFAVDTGAHHTVIDATVVKATGLEINGSGTVRGTGQGDVPTQKVPGFRMKIGKATVPVAEPLVIDLSGVPIPKWVHGLVGAELFEAYVVEMDCSRNLFRLFDPASYSPQPGFQALPFVVENHRMYVDATIEVSAGQTVSHRLRVDTGSEDSVADDVVKGGTNVRETVLGNGLGSNFKGYSGMYKAVHLGPFAFQNVWGPGSPHPAVGMEILRRFTVVFDAPHEKLYLKPNARFNDPFPPPPAQ
jgi:hypothetical protein